MSTRNLQTLLCMVMTALLLSACGGGGGDGSTGTNGATRSANGTYLHVTYNQTPVQEGDTKQQIYFADQNVGTISSIAVRIENRGADVYPLNNISIMPPLSEIDSDTGETRELEDNSEEFTVQVVDDIVLHPAEWVTVDVAFVPITQGQKRARFVVDFETISIADDADSANEQSYYKAADLESAGQFRAARRAYTNYLSSDPVTTNKRRAAIRLPIIEEAQQYDGQEDLSLYLAAMSERDDKNYQVAIRKLDIFTAMYADSYLADDALYLKGYIQLMDMNDPADALRSLQSLRENYPDTTYYDTSMYSEAIAEIDIGNELLAKKILEDLKQRHTGINTFGIQLPKDNLESRMWFERATQMLETLQDYS